MRTFNVINTMDHFPDITNDVLESLDETRDEGIKEAKDALDQARSNYKKICEHYEKISKTLTYRRMNSPKFDVKPCDDCENRILCSDYASIISVKTPAAVISLIKSNKILDVIDCRREDDGHIFVKLNEPHPPCFSKKAVNMSNLDRFCDVDESYQFRHRYDGGSVKIPAYGCSSNCKCGGKCK